MTRGDRLPATTWAVFAGGCVGGLARIEVVRAFPTPTSGFPWSALAVNAGGAFALGLLLVLGPPPWVRSLLGLGFCGAWTTFSAVVVAADQLTARGAVGTAAAYVVVTVLAGLGAARLGAGVGRSLRPFLRASPRTAGAP